MVTVRIHLDRVSMDNAPLKVALGSHRLGLVTERDVARAVAHCDLLDCLAEPGDVWVYATPILHASDKASSGMRRRVLQVDFCAETLPKPLEWLGVE